MPTSPDVHPRIHRYDGSVKPTQHRVPRGARIAALIVAAILGVAACGGSASPGPTEPESRPTPSGPATPLTSPIESDDASPVQTDPPQALQTDTEWGRIRDELPATFPLPAGSQPTQTGQGPASAVLDVPESVHSTMTALQSDLELAGFRTEALSGPLEDGSEVLDSLMDGGCRVQATATPFGGTTILIVLYGAACPFP